MCVCVWRLLAPCMLHSGVASPPDQLVRPALPAGRAVAGGGETKERARRAESRPGASSRPSSPPAPAASPPPASRLAEPGRRRQHHQAESAPLLHG